MPGQFFAGRYIQKLPETCIVDTSLPTFAGITSVTPNADGSFTIGWASGTSTKNPLRYEIYALPGVVSAATLFSTDDNVLQIEPDQVTSARVFTLSDDSTYFVNGQIYTFGVKALDAYGYEGGPATVITSTAIGSGNLPIVYQTIVSDLQDLQTGLEGISSSLAAGAGQQMSININETTMTIDTDGVV